MKEELTKKKGGKPIERTFLIKDADGIPFAKLIVYGKAGKSLPKSTYEEAIKNSLLTA